MWLAIVRAHDAAISDLRRASRKHPANVHVNASIAT